jgi:hypothetical protein
MQFFLTKLSDSLLFLIKYSYYNYPKSANLLGFYYIKCYSDIMPSRYVYQCQTNIVKGASDNTARDSNLAYMSVSDDFHGHICFWNVEIRDITWWIILLILEMAWGSHFLLKMPVVVVSCLMSDISSPWDITRHGHGPSWSWAVELVPWSSWHWLTAVTCRLGLGDTSDRLEWNA